MDESLSNEQVDIAVLPAIESIDFVGLHKEFLTARLIGLTVFWTVLVIGGSLYFIFASQENLPLNRYLLIGLLFVFPILSIILARVGFKRKGYAIREQDISYKTGLFWRSLKVIPYNRIQHVEVQQGLIERSFELARISVFTAGGGGSDLTIPGLTHDEALRLKSLIIDKTKGLTNE